MEIHTKLAGYHKCLLRLVFVVSFCSTYVCFYGRLCHSALKFDFSIFYLNSPIYSISGVFLEHETN